MSQLSLVTDLVITTISALLVGSAGIIPALVVESPDKLNFNELALNRWLSFATGSLLGEVFLHILPDSIDYFSGNFLKWAFAILSGVLIFFTTELLAGFYDNWQTSKVLESSAPICSSEKDSVTQATLPWAVGYLNLFANSIDNFSHGISLGASFAISIRSGLIATSCLLIHEIPHEVSDFIIILRSGFTRWEAIKAQLMTASTCLLGALLVTIFRCNSQDWLMLLPFTAGGFLYIALVSLLPSFLKEKNQRESVIQLCFIMLGMMCIQAITCVHF